MSAVVEQRKSWLSLPTLLTGLGVGLFGLFVLGYFLQTQPGLGDLGANLSFLGLNYFLFPLVGGITLRFAEVKPAPQLVPTPAEIDALRSRCAAPIQVRVLSDISKRSYFKSRHMADALKRASLSRRDEELPVLMGYREELIDGSYGLVLVFDSTRVSRQRWETCQPQLATLFGKSVDVRLTFLGEGAELRTELLLVNRTPLQLKLSGKPGHPVWSIGASRVTARMHQGI